MNRIGKDLAVLTGRNMKGIHFDACISSPLNRAVETCKIILPEIGNKVKIETDYHIREFHFGDLEGKPLSDMDDAGKLFFEDPFILSAFRMVRMFKMFVTVHRNSKKN